MSLWTTFTGVAQVGLAAARGTLCFGERLAPWPLDLMPRLMRLPLDLVAGLVDDMVAKSPRPRSDVGADEQRGEADDAPRDPPRTATIAGTRSEGPDDAPRFDRQVRSRLAPLFTRDAGRGGTIVLLHAFPLNGRMWEPQLEGLAPQFRVVAPDLAGFGLSWVPDATLSFADHARALEITLDDLHVDEMVLVGLSMGGYAAFPLLARLGDRVRGLVLASTRATADDERTAAERHRLAAEVLRDGVEAAASELLPKLLSSTAAYDRPGLVRHVHAVIHESREAGIATALRTMASRPDSTPLLGGIRCPVLVLSGDEDLIVSTPSARLMAERLPDARVEVLRGGHLTNLESPEHFNRALEDFARTTLAGTTRRQRRAANG